LQGIAQSWAKEAKNATVLLFRTDFNLESALEYIRKMSKYVMDTDARITTTSNTSSNASQEKVGKANKGNISIVVRHDLGENFSFYYSRRFLYYFNLLQSVKVSVDYDESTISIRLDKKTG
jgi:hypothetical protein